MEPPSASLKDIFEGEMPCAEVKASKITVKVIGAAGPSELEIGDLEGTKCYLTFEKPMSGLRYTMKVGQIYTLENAEKKLTADTDTLVMKEFSYAFPYAGLPDYEWENIPVRDPFITSKELVEKYNKKQYITDILPLKLWGIHERREGQGKPGWGRMTMGDADNTMDLRFWTDFEAVSKTVEIGNVYKLSNFNVEKRFVGGDNGFGDVKEYINLTYVKYKTKMEKVQDGDPLLEKFSDIPSIYNAVDGVVRGIVDSSYKEFYTCKQCNIKIDDIKEVTACPNTDCSVNAFTDQVKTNWKVELIVQETGTRKIYQMEIWQKIAARNKVRDVEGFTRLFGKHVKILMKPAEKDVKFSRNVIMSLIADPEADGEELP